MMLRGLGDCDPLAIAGSDNFCGGSSYGVDSAGNTIVTPGPSTSSTTVTPLPPPTTGQPTFAQSFFTQTGIQLQSAALFLAGIIFVVSLNKKR